MDTTFVLDTSVAVKWFSPENENCLSQAQQVFNDIESEKVRVWTLDILLVELTNALLISKKLAPDICKNACQVVLKSSIECMPLSSELLFVALELSALYKQTIYDALFLALAQKKNAKVITADKKLMQVKHLTLPLSQYH